MTERSASTPPSAQGPAPHPDPPRPVRSLFEALQRRADLARATGVLVEVLGVSLAAGEALLVGASRRRGLAPDVLAREVLADPTAAARLRGAECGLCGAPAQLRVFGDAGFVRVLVCPDGHGVVCRA